MHGSTYQHFSLLLLELIDRHCKFKTTTTTTTKLRSETKVGCSEKFGISDGITCEYNFVPVYQ